MASCGRPNWYWLVNGTLKIIDGLSALLTLGFWHGPELEMKWVFWRAKVECRKQIGRAHPEQEET